MEEIEKAYALYAGDVYRYLLSLSHNEDVSQDLTQEVFFRAMKTIGRYDGSCKMSVWLCQIAKHLWYQWLDKRSRHNQTELTDQIQGGDSPETATLLHAEKADLYKAIHSLPEPMRELVYLYLTGEFTFAQIAELFGKTESWARVTFHRAKLKLKEELL